MGLIETDALTLKSYSLADADKIVVFLTRSQGLVRGVARGAKRLKSRFGGGLELGSIVNLTFFQKEDRELVSIRDVELIKSFFINTSEPNFFEKFAYIVNLLLEFAQPNDPNERLFKMTTVCLDIAREEPERFDDIVFYFELWLLKLAGYLPDWSICNFCKREVEESEVTSLQTNFHLCCQLCQKTSNKIIVSPEQRQFFLAAQKLSPTKFLNRTKHHRQSVEELSNILKKIITNIVGKEIVNENKLALSPK